MVSGTRMVLERNGIPYYRLNVPEAFCNMAFDEWTPERGSENYPKGSGTIKKITKATNDYMARGEVKLEIARIAEDLVNIRQRRARLPEWEEFAAPTSLQGPASSDDQRLSYDQSSS